MLQILERLGLYHPFNADDVINAEQDNAMHSHRKAVEQLSEAASKRRAVNDELRKSIQEAKQSLALENFEHLLEMDHDRLKGNRK
jgi:hypothetical protein